MKILLAVATAGAAGLAGFVWLIACSECCSPFGDYGKRGGSDL